MIIEALLVLAALAQDHRAAVEGLSLDMATNSVDDQYDGCLNDMRHRVTTEFMKKETSDPKSDFTKAWHDGERNHEKPADNLKTNHSIAIYVYTDIRVYDSFNEAARKDKSAYKKKAYKWYSLHFWLTEAVQILSKTQNKCFDTYRGTEVKYSIANVLNKEVRFGQFASSSLDMNVAKEFGTTSCFEIKTYQSADVTKYSSNKRENEVLIPPYETFNVEDVKTRKNQPDLWCDTVFVLNHSKIESDLNCAVVFSNGKQVASFISVQSLALLCYVFNK